MRFTHCNCYGCENPLKTVKEVKNRICEMHRRALEDDDMFVGVCWKCGNITLVESRQWDRKKKEYYIESKYVFSKGCKICTGDERKNIDWMTVRGGDHEISNIAVTEIIDQNNRRKPKFVAYQPVITDILN